jgi:hypothetical protein
MLHVNTWENMKMLLPVMSLPDAYAGKYTLS